MVYGAAAWSNDTAPYKVTQASRFDYSHRHARRSGLPRPGALPPPIRLRGAGSHVMPTGYLRHAPKPSYNNKPKDATLSHCQLIVWNTFEPRGSWCLVHRRRRPEPRRDGESETMGNHENASRRRPHTISFRVSGAELRLIQAAVEAEGTSRAAWCRRVVLRHARAAALAEGVAAEIESVGTTAGGG